MIDPARGSANLLQTDQKADSQRRPEVDEYGEFAVSWRTERKYLATSPDARRNQEIRQQPHTAAGPIVSESRHAREER